MPISGELKKIEQGVSALLNLLLGELAIVICQFEDYLRIFLA